MHHQWRIILQHTCRQWNPGVFLLFQTRNCSKVNHLSLQDCVLHARQEMKTCAIFTAVKIIHFHHHFCPLDNYVWGENSDLMGCLEQHVKSPRDSRPETDVSIMDCAVLVNIFRPEGCKPFGDNAANLFVTHIKREQNKAQRVDIVWDQYFDNSLKAQTREKPAVGPTQHRRVEVSSPIPKNGQQLLRLNSNKIEFFKLPNDDLMSSASAENR